MTHTPGPWSVTENLFGNTVSYEVYSNVETKSGKGGYTRICQVTPRDQKSNARLISAAPEILEALETMVEMVEMDRFLQDYAMEIAREAIKKARGEE